VHGPDLETCIIQGLDIVAVCVDEGHTNI